MTADEEALAALEAENVLLREFYDSWVFFHQTREETAEVDPRFAKVRCEKAAQMLVQAQHKVAAHIRQNTVAH